MSYNRRRFIKTVIVGSSAVFVDWKELFGAPVGKTLRTKRDYLHFDTRRSFGASGKALPPPVKTESIDHVIVGGGASGIAAAWQLKKSGKEFVLLENEAHLGGVMQNSRPSWKGIEYPLGSTYFARHDGIYKELLADLRVHPIETGEDALWLGTDGAWVDWWNPKVISDLPASPDERDAFRAFRDFLLALPLPTYPVVNAPRDVVDEYDRMPALEFVERFKSPALLSTMELYSRSVLGAPLSDVNAYAFLNFYSIEFGDAFGKPCYTFPGGLGAIAAAAEKYLGSSHVRTNAAVVRVENRNGPGGVDVSYIDRVTGELRLVKARTVIIATSKRVAMQMIPDLSTYQAKAMAALRYTPYVTVALCCNAPLFPVRAFDFWVSDPKGRFTDIIDVTQSSDAATGKLTRGGAFVYMLSAPQPAGAFAGMDEAALDRRLAALAQELAGAVDENIPHAMDKIEELHVFGWTDSMIVPTVGSLTNVAPIISRRHGNIHFANTDNDIAPGWENAVWHGVEAAAP